MCAASEKEKRIKKYKLYGITFTQMYLKIERLSGGSIKPDKICDAQI
jgi:hypothetical protein